MKKTAIKSTEGMNQEFMFQESIEAQVSAMKDFNFNTLEFCEVLGRNLAPTILTFQIFKALNVDTFP